MSSALRGFFIGAIPGALVGAVVTYFVTRHILEAEYQERLEQEIKATRIFFAKAALSPILEEKPEVEEIVVTETSSSTVPGGRLTREAAQAIEKYHGVFQTGDVKDEVVEEVVTTITNNIFRERTVESPEEMERDIRNRTEEAPYIISQEEYLENDLEHTQETLTYYFTDNVLADQTDEPIDDIDEAVGINNLAKFGHRSGDRNTVLIRNCALERDYEVVWNSGSFAVEVLGLDADE